MCFQRILHPSYRLTLTILPNTTQGWMEWGKDIISIITLPFVKF